MSLVKQLAGETAIYGISHILTRVLHFVAFTTYLTYKFEEQGNFGIYTDLYAYATILLVFFSYRMDTAFFRFGSRESGIAKSFSTAFIPMVFVVCIMTFTLFGFANAIAEVLKYPGQSYYVKWFALILAFDALASLPFARFRLEQRPVRFMLFKVFNIIITVLLVLFFLEVCPILENKGWDIIDSWFDSSRLLDYVFIANLIASFLVLILMLPEFFKSKFIVDWNLWKKMLRYSLPLVIVGIAGNFNQAFAVPLQKYLLGGTNFENLTTGGIYAAPAKLALLLNLFAVAFNYAAEPFFFRHSQQQDAKKIYGEVCKAFTIAAVFVLLVIALYIDIIKYIIGPQYHEALHIVPILLFAYLCLGLYYNFSIWYKLVDKTIYGAYISIGGAVITFFMSLFLLPEIGYIASAWAALACYAFMCIAGYLTGRRHYRIEYPLKRMALYIGMAVLLIIISNFISTFVQHTLLQLIINTLLLSFFFFIVYVKDSKFIQSFFT